MARCNFCIIEKVVVHLCLHFCCRKPYYCSTLRRASDFYVILASLSTTISEICFPLMSGKRPPSSDGSSKGRSIEQLKKELAARMQRLGSLSGGGQARPNFCRVCHLSRAKPSRDSPPHFSTCKEPALAFPNVVHPRGSVYASTRNARNKCFARSSSKRWTSSSRSCS